MVCLLYYYVLRTSQLTLVLCSAALFELFALLITSLLWYLIPPLNIDSTQYALVPMSVLVTEALRLAFCHYYVRCERSFRSVSINSLLFPLSDFSSAMAAGCATGTMYVALYCGVVFSHALGPGAVFTPRCEDLSLFVLAAWNGLWHSLLHCALALLMLDAYRRRVQAMSLTHAGLRRSELHLAHQQLALVVLAHETVACSSLLTYGVQDGCRIAMALTAGLTLVTIRLAQRVAREIQYGTRKRLVVSPEDEQNAAALNDEPRVQLMPDDG